MFISPMLASPMSTKVDVSNGQWVAEEKFDGHRLIVEVSDAMAESLYGTGHTFTAWGRYGIPRVLPPHLNDALSELPVGIYDGELLAPGKRSYGVTEIVNGPDLVYIMFDMLQYTPDNTDGTTEDMTDWSYARRRAVMEILPLPNEGRGCLRLSSIYKVTTKESVTDLAEWIWAQDGEGLILKNIYSKYIPGKRSKEWVKIKQLRTAVLTVIGFLPSRGKLNDRGPHAMVQLLDSEGSTTTVKTLNDSELAAFDQQALTITGDEPHPGIGRRLRIEYQERTPDGNYRHPRWDRWEVE